MSRYQLALYFWCRGLFRTGIQHSWWLFQFALLAPRVLEKMNCSATRQNVWWLVRRVEWHVETYKQQPDALAVERYAQQLHLK